MLFSGTIWIHFDRRNSLFAERGEMTTGDYTFVVTSVVTRRQGQSGVWPNDYVYYTFFPIMSAAFSQKGVKTLISLRRYMTHPPKV